MARPLAKKNAGALNARRQLRTAMCRRSEIEVALVILQIENAKIGNSFHCGCADAVDRLMPIQSAGRYFSGPQKSCR
ncbi:MAG TPA: hypothetical protein VKT72_17150 [Candidatus Baltobacteraceae bacterium]|nr:hypothetical protein [Candidatus Baltobacteraceae bacterium]